MRRVDSLDSLRGLAAFAVLLNHCALACRERLKSVPPPWQDHDWNNFWAYVHHTPLKIFFAGDQAVLVFFALSGFVLALTFWKADRWDYRSYIIKRLCRIYLPFLMAIGISAILFTMANPQPVIALSSWFNNASWFHPLTTDIVAGHLVMADAPLYRELDHVVWSLAIELRISMIFPVIAIYTRRNWLMTNLLCIAISASALACHHFMKANLLFDPFLTLQYLYLFSAGATLAFKASEIRILLDRQPPSVRASLWIATLIMVTFPANKHFGLFICGTAAIMLVALSFADTAVDAHLSKAIPKWLGRVSYSLYLLHVPVLLFVLHCFYGTAPLVVLLAAVIAVSLALAELSYRFVEHPTITLGRFLADKSRRSTPLTATLPAS
jgi:peptidoglycan/LPS O-acetylase OafA/YrhL